MKYDLKLSRPNKNPQKVLPQNKIVGLFLFLKYKKIFFL